MRKIVQQYAKELTAGRLASGYEHSYRVYHLAREIGEGLEYDDEVLHAACFLHDTERFVGHPESSAEKAQAILVETGFIPDSIPTVYDAIAHHMPGGNPTSVEGKLLHDANLLDSIGAIGFSRLSIGSFSWHHYRTMEEVLEHLKKWLSYTDDFFYDASREMAKGKVEFTKLALRQFAEELDL